MSAEPILKRCPRGIDATCIDNCVGACKRMPKTATEIAMRAGPALADDAFLADTGTIYDLAQHDIVIRHCLDRAQRDGIGIHKTLCAAVVLLSRANRSLQQALVDEMSRRPMQHFVPREGSFG